MAMQIVQAVLTAAAAGVPGGGGLHLPAAQSWLATSAGNKVAFPRPLLRRNLETTR